MHYLFSTDSTGNIEKNPIEDILIDDPIGDALKDARRFYERDPTGALENLIEELKASERLHKSGLLPKDKAIRHLRNYADHLDEDGFEARAIEVRKIIDDQSID